MSIYAGSSKIKSLKISSNYGKSVDIAGGVTSMCYFESVFDLSVRCTINVIDAGFRSGQGKVGALEEDDLNLTVGEDITMKLEDNFENPLEGDLVIQNVGNIIEHTQYNGYTIHCYSKECVNNEFVENRVVKRYDGKITDYISSIITDHLKTDKEIKIDPCLNEFNFIGHVQKPFYIIPWLAKRTVPDMGSFGDLAGYLFWETSKGYNFRSIDMIFKEKNIVKKFVFTNTFRTPNQYDGSILDYSWSENIDLESKLLTSAYNPSQQRTFNAYDNEYIETAFDPKVQFGENIGGLEQPKINAIAGKASRIASNWVDVGVLPKGSNLKKQLEKSKDELNFDTDKILRQSFARYNNLFSHKLTIKIPGDFTINAGDLVSCDFPEISDKINQAISRKKSGIYMVIDVSHYITSNGTFTGLNLARESIYREPISSPSGKSKNSNDAVSL
jgi:hypothetical protein